MLEIINIKIKQYRKSCELTQEDIANKLKISLGSVKMYENGTRKPSKKIKEDICTLFNISINELEGLNDRIKLKNEIVSKLNNLDFTDNEIKELKRNSINFFYNIGTENEDKVSLMNKEKIKGKENSYIVVIRAIIDFIEKNYFPYIQTQTRDTIESYNKHSMYTKQLVSFIHTNINFIENTINEVQFNTKTEKYLIPLLSSISLCWEDNVNNANNFLELPNSLKLKDKLHFAFYVQDDSMNSRYCNNDIAIVEWGDNYKNKDDIIVYINGKVHIRRILKNKTGIILQPLNPNYDIESYSNYEIKEKDIQIIGKIIGIKFNN